MNKATEFKSGHFSFLSEHDVLFVELAESAERAFASGPNTALIKLRQLGEAMADLLCLGFPREKRPCANVAHMIDKKISCANMAYVNRVG